MTRAQFELFTTGVLPPLTGATAWLNSPPLTPAELRGKVVLISFWTYTCINWLRTLPYIRAWAEKYKDYELVVVGVHTPEFPFEHNIDNVMQALARSHITYPVVVDNSYAIWTAFHNHYWPALYFADAEGYIRYQQFGEGEYEMSERAIQELLFEAGKRNVPDDLVSVEPQGAEVAADWEDVESPETYLGYERAFGFASPGGIVLGRSNTYENPGLLKLNQWSLMGNWTIEEQAIVCNQAGGRLSYNFHARDLNLVMGPTMQNVPIQFRVRINHEAPQEAHGFDVDKQGKGTAVEQRLYQLIRQPQPIADRHFEIEFLSPGIEALAFTFG